MDIIWTVTCGILQPIWTCPVFESVL